MYTAEQKVKAEEYITHERNVTLRLAGMTEDELTPEQDRALTDYVRVSAAIYLAKWGPEGPRGAVLRAETDAEAEARIEWEESIKSAEQKRKERVCNLVTFNLEGYTDDDQRVRVTLYDEMYEPWRQRYVAEGLASEQDTMYDLVASVYDWYKHALYDIHLAVVIGPEETVNVVRTWCNLIECRDYIRQLKEDGE